MTTRALDRLRAGLSAHWARPGVREAVVLAALALIVRLAWVGHVLGGHRDLAIFSDSAGYLDPAHSLLDHLRFDLRAGSDQPMWIRTPGYPTFLAAVGGLFGRSLGPILIAQALLGAGSVYLVARTGHRLLGRTGGLVAGGLLAVDPSSVLIAGHVLTEALAQVLMAGLALGLCAAISTDRRRSWLLVGLLLACATLVRPTMYYLLPVLAVAVAWPRRADRRSVARIVGALVLPSLVLVGAWQVRNLVVVDSARYTPIDGFNLAAWRGAAIEFGNGGYETYRDAQHAVVERVALAAGAEDPDPVDLLRTYPPADVEQDVYWAEMRSEGVRLARSDPARYVEETVLGFRAMLFATNYAEEAFAPIGSPDTIATALRLWLVAVYLLAIGGTYRLLRRVEPFPAHVTRLFGLVTMFVFILSSGPEGEERMRTPVMPLIVVLAAATFARTPSAAPTPEPASTLEPDAASSGRHDS